MQTTVETRLREAEDRARLAQNVLSAALVLDEAGIAPRSTLAHRLFHECVRLDDEHAMRRHIQASTRLAGVPLPAAAAAPSGQRRKPYAQGALDLFASLTVAPDTFGRSIRGRGGGYVRDRRALLHRHTATGLRHARPQPRRPGGRPAHSGWAGVVKSVITVLVNVHLHGPQAGDKIIRDGLMVWTVCATLDRWHETHPRRLGNLHSRVVGFTTRVSSRRLRSVLPEAPP